MCSRFVWNLLMNFTQKNFIQTRKEAFSSCVYSFDDKRIDFINLTSCQRNIFILPLGREPQEQTQNLQSKPTQNRNTCIKRHTDLTEQRIFQIFLFGWFRFVGEQAQITLSNQNQNFQSLVTTTLCKYGKCVRKKKLLVR